MTFRECARRSATAALVETMASSATAEKLASRGFVSASSSSSLPGPLDSESSSRRDPRIVALPFQDLVDPPVFGVRLDHTPHITKVPVEPTCCNLFVDFRDCGVDFCTHMQLLPRHGHACFDVTISGLERIRSTAAPDSRPLPKFGTRGARSYWASFRQ